MRLMNRGFIIIHYNKHKLGEGVIYYLKESSKYGKPIYREAERAVSKG